MNGEVHNRPKRVSVLAVISASPLAASFAQREVLSWGRSQTPQIAGGPDSGRAFEVLRLGVPAPHIERARAPVNIVNLDQVAMESKAIPRL